VTTAKTVSELESLVVTEMQATCPECQEISGAVIVTTDAQHEDGWAIAELVQGPLVA
jgi:hypothetical protein